MFLTVSTKSARLLDRAAAVPPSGGFRNRRARSILCSCDLLPLQNRGTCGRVLLKHYAIAFDGDDGRHTVDWLYFDDAVPTEAGRYAVCCHSVFRFHYLSPVEI